MKRILDIDGVEEIAEQMEDGVRLRCYVHSKLTGMPYNQFHRIPSEQLADPDYMRAIKDNVAQSFVNHI